MPSKFWTLSNEDSRARFFRENYVAKNGGSWSRGPQGWTWSGTIEEKVVSPQPKKKKTLFRKGKDDK